MGRDYAQRGRGKRQVQASKGLPGWFWGVVGISVGLGIAGIAWIVLRPLPAPTDAPTAVAPQVTSAPRAKIATPSEEEPRFKFYDLLKEFEVKPNPEPYEPHTRDPKADDNTRYLIQAGSFAHDRDAERRKAELALLGVESIIRAVNLDTGGTRHRVMIGPEKDYQNVRKTMRLLAENDIESFPLRLQKKP